MGKLTDNSGLYAELSSMYDARKDKNFSLKFFNKCVDKALKYSKREMKYVIFNLKSLYDDTESGIEKVNSFMKIIKLFVGDSFKASFIITVLETALDEKK